MLIKNLLKETNQSPLLYFTKKQSEKLNNKIGNENTIIDFAMRYETQV